MVSVERATEWARQTLGVSQLESATSHEILSGALAWLENANAWGFLEAGQAPLSLVADVPYIELPDDFAAYTGDSAAGSVLNSMTFTSPDQVLQMRQGRSVSSGLHFWVAPIWLPRPMKNLLTFSEDLTASVWQAHGDVPQVVTANQEQGSHTLETTGDLLEVNAAGGNLKSALYDIDYTLLRTGTYVASIDLKLAVTAPVHTSNKSLIKLAIAGHARQQVAEIDWAASPPTITQHSDTSGTGGGQALTVLSNGWVRAEVAVSHDATLGQGRLRFQVFPTDDTAETGGVHADRAQVELAPMSVVDHIITGTSKRATAYQPVLGSVRRTAEVQKPALMCWPVPSESKDTLAITYRRTMSRITEATEFIDLPPWMRPLFREAVITFARGWHEEDQAMLFQRLEPLRQTSLFDDAAGRDYDEMAVASPMRNGHTSARRWIYLNWDTGQTATLPT